MKYNYIDIGEKIKLTISSIAMAGIIAIGGFVVFKSCSPVNQDAVITIKNKERNSDKKKLFKKGEHIISTKIFLDKEEINQIPYHDGYRLQGITIDSDGKTAIYTNTEDVWCVSGGTDKNNNDVFNEFGVTDHYETSNDYFEAYEHTLAVPISDPSNNNLQYVYHEGYEVIDIASYVYGRYTTYGGGFIIYANTVPVKSTTDNKEECLQFGEVISTEKIKTLR